MHTCNTLIYCRKLIIIVFVLCEFDNRKQFIKYMGSWCNSFYAYENHSWLHLNIVYNAKSITTVKM